MKLLVTGRRGLHRLGRRPPHHPRHRLARWSTSTSSPMPATSSRCADAARQRPATASSRPTSATAPRSTRVLAERRSPTRSCISPPRAMSTARSTAPRRFIQTNVVGTFTLLEAARAYWRALPAERRGALPLPPCLDRRGVRLARRRRAVHARTRPTGPTRPIRRARPASDHLVRAWHHTYGLPTLVTNCSNNYGPYHFPEKLIPLMIIRALRGETLPVYGKGENVRDWLHVEDHAEALLPGAAARAGPARPTMSAATASAEHRRRRTHLRACSTSWRPTRPHRPHDELIRFVADRPGHDLRYAIDAAQDRARARLAAAPRFRERPAPDRALVSRPRGLVGTRHERRISRRAPGLGLEGNLREAGS